jgi:hypothetical protein
MESPFWSQGLNRYSYVFNNPLNATDPSGYDAEDEEDFVGFDCDGGACGDIVFADDPLNAGGAGEVDTGSLDDGADEEAETSPAQGEPDDSAIGESPESLNDVAQIPDFLGWDPSVSGGPQPQPHAEAPSAHLPHPTAPSEWGWHVYTTLMILIFNPGVANTPQPDDVATYNQQTGPELGIGAIPPWLPGAKGLGAAKELTNVSPTVAQLLALGPVKGFQVHHILPQYLGKMLGYTAEQMTEHPGTFISQWSHTGALNPLALHKAISHYLPPMVDGQKATYSAAQIRGGLQQAYADVGSSDLFGAIEHLIP